ncbi:MAG: dihydropteroate synthase [Pseudomonadota bacterium]
MGILNLTPDSFSDGGCWLKADDALRHAAQMVAQGAALIDVGGESTRPGAAEVHAAEELDRVVPIIEQLVQRLDVVISVDTMKPAVMRAALAAGATMVNDVNALREPGAIEAVAASQAAVCLMHMQGVPRSMQGAPQYKDVVSEVRAALAARVQACAEAGIDKGRMLIDPGIGFGKTLAHNLTLLAHLDDLAVPGVPLLLGVSRKSLFGQLLGLKLHERLLPSVVVAALAVAEGAAIVRAHDVAETVLALKTAQAIRDARRPQR